MTIDMTWLFTSDNCHGRLNERKSRPWSWKFGVPLNIRVNTYTYIASSPHFCIRERWLWLGCKLPVLTLRCCEGWRWRSAWSRCCPAWWVCPWARGWARRWRSVTRDRTPSFVASACCSLRRWWRWQCSSARDTSTRRSCSCFSGRSLWISTGLLLLICRW